LLDETVNHKTVKVVDFRHKILRNIFRKKRDYFLFFIKSRVINDDI